VKFIIDAQLPKSLANWLKNQRHDAIHTLDLPDANQSDDREIITVADRENRIVVSKDSDFFDDHIIRGIPKQLLVVKT